MRPRDDARVVPLGSHMTIDTKILHSNSLGRAHWGDDDNDTLITSNLNPYQDAVAVSTPQTQQIPTHQITDPNEIAALESYAQWNPGIQYNTGDIAEFE